MMQKPEKEIGPNFPKYLQAQKKTIYKLICKIHIYGDFYSFFFFSVFSKYSSVVMNDNFNEKNMNITFKIY